MTTLETRGRPGRARRSLAVWGAVAALVLLPLLAMRLISEPDELVFVGAIIVCVGVAYEIATRVPGRFAYAAGLMLAALTVLAVVFVNGAVGIIGSEDNPQNRVFFAPIAVAVAGSLVALLRARGLALAMAAAAVAQVGVFVFAWAAGYSFTGPISVFFTAMWLIAGGLFRRAAAARAVTGG
jgi:hypothetical protein